MICVIIATHIEAMPNRTDKGKNVRTFQFLVARNITLILPILYFQMQKICGIVKKYIIPPALSSCNILVTFFLNESLIFYLKFSIGFKIIEQI